MTPFEARVLIQIVFREAPWCGRTYDAVDGLADVLLADLLDGNFSRCPVFD